MDTAHVVTDIRAEGDWTVLELAGELDGLTAPQLHAVLNQLIDEGHCRLVMELHQVSFVDSAGLGVLVYAWRRVQARGGLRLAGVCDRIWRKLHCTGLEQLLPVYRSVGEAISETDSAASLSAPVPPPLAEDPGHAQRRAEQAGDHQGHG
jgi:anti-sigma B factor antagonist